MSAHIAVPTHFILGRNLYPFNRFFASFISVISVLCSMWW